MSKLGQKKRRELLLASMLGSLSTPSGRWQSKVPNLSNGPRSYGAGLVENLVQHAAASMPDPEESWAVVELYRLQHGELPPQDGTAKPVQISEGLKVIADMVESHPDKLPPRFSVATVLRYVAKEIAKQDSLESEIAAAWKNRDHFCEHINIIGREVIGPRIDAFKGDCCAPDAVSRETRLLIESLESRKNDLEALSRKVARIDTGEMWVNGVVQELVAEACKLTPLKAPPL